MSLSLPWHPVHFLTGFRSPSQIMAEKYSHQYDRWPLRFKTELHFGCGSPAHIIQHLLDLQYQVRFFELGYAPDFTKAVRNQLQPVHIFL